MRINPVSNIMFGNKIQHDVKEIKARKELPPKTLETVNEKKKERDEKLLNKPQKFQKEEISETDESK